MLLCIDGGGTGSRAQLFDPEGNILAQGEGGPCNPNNHHSQAVESIHRLWQDIASQAGLDPSKPIAAGIAAAGLVNPAVRQRFVADLPRFESLKVMADGFAALVGASQGKPAGRVAVGTGAVAHRLYEDGHSVQRDGWGWMGGDRGSGCWIGQRAVRHALCVRDGTAKPSELAEQINQHIGLRDGQLMAWLHDAGPTKFASLVPKVIELDNAGDWAAKDIVTRAYQHIARLVDCLQLPPEQCCYLAGSLGRLLHDRIQQETHTRLEVSAGAALSGCRLVAIGVVSDDGFADHGCAGT